MSLIEVLLIVFGGPILIIFLIKYISWRKIKKNKIQISFNQFYSIYKSTPADYWNIKDKYSVGYEKHSNNYYQFYCETEIIFFKTLLDLIRFQIFLYKYKANNKKIQKDQIKQQLDKNTADLIANWTRDIERTRKYNIEKLQRMINENTAKAKEYEKRLKELKNET